MRSGYDSFQIVFVLGMIVFGLAAKSPGSGDPMLRLHLGGPSPSLGEKHYASASDCSPWISVDGSFIAHGKVADEGREEACQLLMDEWRELEASYTRGAKSGVARWVPGCPVRVSIGGVGGHRMLVLTPEPVL